MWLVGEIKLRRRSLYQYTRPKRAGQLDAIVRYARKYVYPRTAVFMSLIGGNMTKAKAARQLIRKRALKEGTLAIIVSSGYIGL
jgi:hypothetical protein